MKKMIIFESLIIVGLLSFYIYKITRPEIKQLEKPNTIETTFEEPEEIIDNTPKYIDNNPIKLGIFKNYKDGKPRQLVTTYETKWQYHKDLSYFEIYFTSDLEVPNTTQRKLIGKYIDNYENIDNYRIGYQVEFNTNEKTFNKMILSPKDTEEFYDILEIYLYDDYHRTGGWYSHTTEEQYNENTLLTSIKLTAGKKIEEITSDIILTAFTYDEDDFDENGNYRGISKYTIIVKKVIT